MTWSGIFARLALIVLTGAMTVTAAMATDQPRSRSGAISAGGPVGLNIRTNDGRSQMTTIMWAGDSRELTVVNLSDPVAPGAERDVYETMRMLLQRCTAITLGIGRASGPGGCCPSLSGSGVGFAGNVKTKLRIDQAFEGGRVRQTVTIYGYKGPAFDGYTARLLFQ